MNKKVLFFEIVILILFVMIVLVISGKTAHVQVDLGEIEYEPENLTLIIENEDIIKLTEKGVYDGKFKFMLQSVKPGISNVTVLNGEEVLFMDLFYVHPLRFIARNTVLGHVEGDWCIQVSLILLLLSVLIDLVRNFQKSIRKNLYQQKNIRYLGMILYLGIVLIMVALSTSGGLIRIVRSLLSSAESFSIFVFPVAFLLFIFVTVSSIQLMIREGVSWKNMLGVILGMQFLLLTVGPQIVSDILQQAVWIDVHNEKGWATYFSEFVLTTSSIICTYLECLLVGTILIVVKAGKHMPQMNKDYLLILGCQIRKDGTLPPLLKGRADRAVEFAKLQRQRTGKPLVYVPSGGQGTDECCSEAEAIHNYLISIGIKENEIVVENQSTTTYENFANSLSIIYPNRAQKSPKIAFSTTNYHVFRSGVIASSMGITVEGIGSKTKWYFWINAMIREYIAILVEEKRNNLIYMGIFEIILVILIFIQYISILF